MHIVGLAVFKCINILCLMFVAVHNGNVLIVSKMATHIFIC